MYHCGSLLAETLAIACPMTIAACSYTAKGPVQASQNTVVDRKSSPEGAYMQLLLKRGRHYSRGSYYCKTGIDFCSAAQNDTL